MPNHVRLQVTGFIFLFLICLGTLLFFNLYLHSAVFVFLGFCILYIYWPIFDPFGHTFWHGDRKQRTIALTFDDGPDPKHTSKILDILKELNIRASFFLLGNHAKEHPQLVKRIINEGHEIGNHGFSHKRFSFLRPKAIQRELKQIG